MPAQIWTPAQKLTAAELTSLTNMLPYFVSTSAAVNPCVAGTLYRCTSSTARIMTLPAPSIGTIIGFLIDSATSGGITITHNASEVILGPYMTDRAQTTLKLSYPDSYVVLHADGTNWHEIASGGVGPLGLLTLDTATATQSGIVTPVDLGLTGTITVPAGRIVRVTGYCMFQYTSGAAIAAMYIMEGSTQLQSCEIPISSASSAGIVIVAILTPTAGAHTYKLQAQGYPGTIATTSAAVQPAFMTIEDMGSI